MSRRLTSLDQHAALRSSNEERRAAARYRAGLRVPCRLVDDAGSPDWKARVRDVSTLGIALLLPRPPELGRLLEIELQKANGILVRPVRARVIHVEEDESKNWIVGCTFTSELTEAELRLFRAEAVRPKTKDHRRRLRFPCHVETLCYTCETTPGERRPARVLNVSPGGVGLLLPCQFSQGTLLQLELPSEAKQPARALPIRVTRVLEQSQGMWFLGCEFAHRLEKDELRALVQR